MSRNTVPIVVAALGLAIALAVLTGAGRSEVAPTVIASSTIAGLLAVGLSTGRQRLRRRPVPVRVRASDRRPR